MTELYLTRLPVTTLVTDGKRFTLNKLHKAVMALFPERDETRPETARQQFGVLHRIDDSVNGQYVTITSATAPTNLPTGARTRPLPSAENLEPGDTVEFRLDLTAVHRYHDENSKYRTAVRSFADTTQFVSDVLAGALDIETVYDTTRHRYPAGRGTAKWFTIDTIEGEATIRNTETLSTLLTAGVGRGKAFGSGMLTINKI